MRDRSRVQHSWARANASAPRAKTRPMCDRSNRPHPERTAWCSARMPDEYWTGMSQPAKSTMRAPSRRCSAVSGVCNSAFAALASLEGKAVAKHSRQQRGDPGELFGEQQHAHADYEDSAHPLNGEHM